jgi:endonuclease/exonuclease/phosphatase family metal-dependent hydrolase
MRLATFNLESLDLGPGAGGKAHIAFATRAAVLRPALERLDADILCLQEVNGQHVAGERERRLIALDRLLEGTRYQGYARAVASAPGGHGISDVHNLVTLSRFPIKDVREVLHDHVAPPVHTSITAEPGAGEQVPVRFDRPLLVTEIAVPEAPPVWVVNVHLRAPLASPVPGQKSGPFAWRTSAGWAEGFYLSAVKREAQALELRLAVEALLRKDPECAIAVAGDFNAEDYGPTLRLAIAGEEDMGAGELAGRSLIVLDRAIAADRRYSVLHHGRQQMLDHILASRALYGHFRAIEVHNEGLGDEALGYGKAMQAAASYHAPLVATFDLGRASAP